MDLYLRTRGIMSSKAMIWLAFLSLLFVPSILKAQQLVGNKLYQLGWDNDVFMMSDHYYTQGMSLSMYHPFFKYNPANLILLKPKAYDKVIYGLSVDQKTFTPQDIASEEVQFNDRPYAGVLVFSLRSVAADINKGLMIKSELDLGVMGPASGAGDIQYHYHDLTNNQLPNGWVYQHYNWPIVNYNVLATKSFYESNVFELYGKGSARLGTLHDDATLSLMMRTGKMTNYIESLGLSLPYDGGKWQFFMEVEPSVTMVAYNATMQGGWHRNPKIHYLDYADLSPVVARFKTGLGLVYKRFGVNFNVHFTTKEFKQGDSHWFNSTRLFLTF